MRTRHCSRARPADVGGPARLLLAVALAGGAADVLANGPPPPPQANLGVRVFPATPVLEHTGGQQHLNFEFRLDARGGPVRLLNILVRTYDPSGGLLRYRQLVPANYQGNFSEVALFDGKRFVGSQPFDLTGPIPGGGRVLFFNPWHSFSEGDPLGRLSYTFYFVDDRGRVNTTAVEVRPQPARPMVALRLPLAGRWLVIEGHDYETHHRRIFSPINAQRFASDFVALQPGDRLYNDEGTRVTDYASFGAAVVSPGAGVVVARENRLSDNPVGARDDLNPYGNHVVIDHGSGLHSVLAHLQQGSVGVKVGDRVVAGQPVARVGNSGASDLPHLHYHLQKGPELGINRGEGMVALFARYHRVVGTRQTLVDLGSPATGEVVVGQAARRMNSAASVVHPKPAGTRR